MGYALYEEFHGSGRWGYYYDYIIGECSIGKCKQGKQGMLQLFSPPDAGEYKNEDFPFLTDDLYFQTRNKSYPNFAGVVKNGYKVDYPTIDSYLTICGTKK